MRSILNFFQFSKYQTSLRIEVLAGLTTFLTLSYIIVVNPMILGYAGMDRGAVFVATIIISALSSFCMGIFANYPIALAPTMGMNAYFTYAVVKGMGYSWESALGAVFISGIIFTLFTLCRLRSWVIYTLPPFLKTAISSGIGAFLGIIALKNAGLITAAPKALPHLGSLIHIEGWITLSAFALILLLNRWRVPGAIMFGIAAATGIGIIIGKAKFLGIVAWPPSIKPVFFALHVPHHLDLNFVVVVLTFFFIGFFDTTGTLIGLLHRAGIMSQSLEDPRFKRALQVDSSSNIVCALLGTSVVGCFIESASGIYAGGRTGLTAITVSFLFLLSLFFAPLVDTIPNYASAAALLFVASMMLRGLKEIAWSNFRESIPSLCTVIVTPLTYSIAYGISAGYLMYIFLFFITGRWRELSWSSLILAASLTTYLALAW